MSGRRRLQACVGVAALVVAVAAPAPAAPHVTITSPAEGATVELGVGGTVTVRGTAAFDTPERGATFRYYLRRSNCGTSEDRRYLSPHPGSDDASGCGYFFDTPLTPVRNEQFTGELPFELPPLDTTRHLTGRVVLANPRCPYTGAPACLPTAGGAGAGQATTTVSLRVLDSGAWRTLASTTATYTVRPDQAEYPVEIDVALPAGEDAKEPRLAALLVSRSGPVVSHGAFVLNGASFIDIPTYTASFRTSLEVAVDADAFSTEGVQLATDGSWTAQLAGLDAGPHVVEARAWQGSEVSEAALRSFEVTQ